MDAESLTIIGYGVCFALGVLVGWGKGRDRGEDDTLREIRQWSQRRNGLHAPVDTQNRLNSAEEIERAKRCWS